MTLRVCSMHTKSYIKCYSRWLWLIKTHKIDSFNIVFRRIYKITKYNSIQYIHTPNEKKKTFVYLVQNLNISVNISKNLQPYITTTSTECNGV